VFSLTALSFLGSTGPRPRDIRCRPRIWGILPSCARRSVLTSRPPTRPA